LLLGELTFTFVPPGDRVYFVQSSKVKSGIWIKSLELRVTRVI
jgi:hypothetical protein